MNFTGLSIFMYYATVFAKFISPSWFFYLWTAWINACGLPDRAKKLNEKVIYAFFRKI